MAQTWISPRVFATLLALIVVLLGAYTRLTHAGLGCRTAGCYGLSRAARAKPNGPCRAAPFPMRRGGRQRVGGDDESLLCRCLGVADRSAGGAVASPRVIRPAVKLPLSFGGGFAQAALACGR